MGSKIFKMRQLYSPFLDGSKTIVASGSLMDKYVDDNGVLDLSLINLSDMLSINKDAFLKWAPTLALLPQKNAAFFVGPSPYRPQAQLFGQKNSQWNPHGGSVMELNLPGKVGVPPYRILISGDTSSNSVCWFNVPNLYYGDRIRPGSLTMNGRLGFSKFDRDLPFTTVLGMTLKDNGNGGLYRADCNSKHATWNNVGDILYAEGFIIIKSPHIFDFGMGGGNVQDAGHFFQAAAGEHYSMDFQGERNIHVLETMIPTLAGQFTSSSNPSFKKLLPSDHVNDYGTEFVYITGLNFHDDNFNIIARTNLAQPVIKRHGDKLFFRVKIDY